MSFFSLYYCSVATKRFRRGFENLTTQRGSNLAFFNTSCRSVCDLGGCPVFSFPESQKLPLKQTTHKECNDQILLLDV